MRSSTSRLEINHHSDLRTVPCFSEGASLFLDAADAVDAADTAAVRLPFVLRICRRDLSDSPFADCRSFVFYFCIVVVRDAAAIFFDKIVAIDCCQFVGYFAYLALGQNLDLLDSDSHDLSCSF